jgi:hypothetical protein
MTTATRTRNRLELHVNVSKPVNGTFAVHMTIGTGEKAKHFGYYLTPIPADLGLGFHVEKFGVEQIECEPSEYDVNLDLERGYHSCTCKGNTYHGHCKHVEALLSLIQSGKIAVPAPKQPARREPWCSHCNDNPEMHCSHCSL